MFDIQQILREKVSLKKLFFKLLCTQIIRVRKVSKSLWNLIFFSNSSVLHLSLSLFQFLAFAVYKCNTLDRR